MEELGKLLIWCCSVHTTIIKYQIEDKSWIVTDILQLLQNIEFSLERIPIRGDYTQNTTNSLAFSKLPNL